MRSQPAKLARSFHLPNPAGEAVSFLAAFAFGALMQMLLKKFWEGAFGHEAPLNPSQPGVKWGEALAWGLFTGAASGLVKVVARRGTDLARQRLSR
jgi:hypothetical protein